ncbi:MAG TPA: tetratricopeptide repeat protein [bacterium]|nr:tetratricopeptide repeat protein [bacterium]
MNAPTPETPAPFPQKPTGSFAIDLWRVALGGVFLLTALFATRLINDFDLGFHLKGGQWILEHHAFPSKDTYTYTANDRDYIDLHWLYQVGLYLLYRVGNYPLLTAANVILILLVFFITFQRLRLAGAPHWLSAVLLSMVLFASEIRFQVRPEILTWLCLSLMLWILELKCDRNRDKLFFLLPVQWIWANVEGLFALGWPILLIFLISSFLEGEKTERRTLKFAGGSIALCLANPYLLRGFFFPFTLLLTLGTSNAQKGAINEFQSPWTLSDLYFFPPEWTLWAYKLFSFFLIALFLATRSKRKPREWMLVLFLFFLSTLALRNIPLFMIGCAPLAANAWRDLTWERARQAERTFLSKPVTAGLVLLLFLGIACRVVTGAYYLNERRYDRFGLGLDQEQQPVKATEFLVQNHLDGKILNHLNLGGWLDWRAPQKTFIDGRLEVMGQEFFSVYLDSLRVGGLPPLVEKFQPDILFFNPENASPWVMDLAKDPQWRPVYLDEAAVIYLREGYAPQIPAMNNDQILSDRKISLSVLQEEKDLLQLERPSAWSGFVDDFTKSPSYHLGLNALGAFYSLNGQFDIAESVFLENIRRTQGRYVDLYFNLGSMFFNANRIDEARLCIRRVLEEVPRKKMAQYLRANMPARAE